MKRETRELNGLSDHVKEMLPIALLAVQPEADWGTRRGTSPRTGVMSPEYWLGSATWVDSEHAGDRGVYRVEYSPRVTTLGLVYIEGAMTEDLREPVAGLMVHNLRQ